MVKQSKEAKQRLQQLFKGGQFAIRWGFIPLVIYLGFKRAADPGMPEPTCCGIAMTAECIFFVSDQQSLYPLPEATNNDDIYGAAWIGIFVGICLFCLSILGIVGIMKSSRKILLAYFILMFIVYAFEVASCITGATQRDFFTPNLFLKQMLERYQNNSPPNNDDQ
ncbi:Uroplakin-1b [Saguinus oedipus]|uniref:Uroplakin-1b n=1 Tax=Saguinus oedipus TaxID=9490 RepID=A0ABQ9V382_SAGOE|nr:Uroplakin-1b [Saguinus oedipus]